MLKLTGKASDFLNIAVKAAARNDIPLVKEILKIKPHWLFHIGSHGRTMLWEACHKGKLEMVKFLVEKGADINACGTHYTPYFVELSCYCIAKYKKHHQVAEYLLENDADLTIHTAAFLGDLETIKNLLNKNPGLINEGHAQHIMAGKNSKGLDFIPKMMEWATPLCYSLRGGDISATNFLINSGAKISGFDEQLFTAADDNPEMLRILLSNDANTKFAPSVSPSDTELYTLMREFNVEPMSMEQLSEELVYLCRGDRGGNPADVKRLLDDGAQIDYQDKKGKTALHRAARAGFLETIKVLIDRGARIDIVDQNGETALFEPLRSTIKIAENKQNAFTLLLKAGSNPSHRNAKEETVKDVAAVLNISWM